MARQTSGSSRTPRRSRAKRRRITPGDLERFHLVSSPQVSPNGRSIVFVKKNVGEKNEYGTNLWRVSTDGGEAPRSFTSGGKDSHPRWSPDGSQIAFIAAREKGKPQIYTIPAGGGEAVKRTDFPEGTIGTFQWSPDGKTFAVSFREQHPDWTGEAKRAREEKGLGDPPRVVEDWWYRLDGDGYFLGQRHHLYLVDVATGDRRDVYGKDAMGQFTFDWAPDSKRIVLATNRDPKAMIKPWKDELLLLNVSSGKLRAVAKLPAGPKAAPRWSPDGKRIAYLGREGTDGAYSVENLELWVCDPARGQARSLTGREDYCLMAGPITDTAEVSFASAPEWSPDGRRIYMLLGWHGESHIASVGSRGGKVLFHTRGPRAYTMGNVSADGRTMALTASATNRIAEVYSGRIGGGAIATEKLTDLNGPVHRQLDLAKPTSHWVRAADGTRVQVWVMRPVGFKRGRRYPAVLEIHGGPHTQYGVGFFHEFQVLAANGYVVFYSNPRGSKGYGRDHCAAIRGSWGGADWMDIQAVTGFIRSCPFVDSRRMGVMGGSYGGYMTNWVIGHTREFAAAITDRCVSNLVSMSGNSDFIEAPDDYFPGNFWDRAEPRWDQSPIKYFGNVRTPTLIIHSEGDLRCNVEQSEQVFAALKLRNVPTKFVRYPRSTFHGLSRGGPPNLRIHRLEQIVGWWKKYLKA